MQLFDFKHFCLPARCMNLSSIRPHGLQVGYKNPKSPKKETKSNISSMTLTSMKAGDRGLKFAAVNLRKGRVVPWWKF